jgi:predicted metal-dependent peptidase
LGEKNGKRDRNMMPTPVVAEATPAEERECLQRISVARTTVNAFTPFFGYLVLKMVPVVARPGHQVDTAAISPDGTLYVNHHFLKTLSDPEVAGLIVHEVMHPALLCWKRQGPRRAMVCGPDMEPFSLWNLAHDMSFNPEIEELATKCKAKGKIKLPKDAALDARFIKQSAEQIYDVLLREAEKNKKKQGGGGGVRGILEKIPGSASGKNGIGNDLRDDLSKSKDGKRASQGDKGAQQKIENNWRVSVVAAAQVHEAAKGQGSLPGGIKKFVDELQEAKVDWMEVLSQWLGENGRRSDYSFRRPARRSESVGEYMPSHVRCGVADVAIVWDTSGSMNGREAEILSEVRGICEDLGTSVRVICCDTKIHSDVKDIQEALDMIPHIKGGGGSDFTPAFDLLDKENYDGVVVSFTDGFITVPQTKPPLIKDVLWCLANHDTDPTNGRWGQILRIEDKKPDS